MRLLFLLMIGVLMPFSPLWAVTGDDVVPGMACSVNKAMMMTANPTGIGGYILTCENGEWVATLTASLPTLPDQVATKRYIDEHVATIESHTYSNPKVYTTMGTLRPILISGLQAIDLGRIAADLCSMFSDGVYVQGKMTAMRRIDGGYRRDMAGTFHLCKDACITGPSGNLYAWYHAADFKQPLFYTNASAAIYWADNAAEVATNNCGTWVAGDLGTITVNGECLAEPSATRSSLSGTTRPNYNAHGYVVEELLCWAN